MKKFLVIVLMLLVSVSSYAENNEKMVSSVSYQSDYDNIVKVGITFVANEKFETRFAMDSGMLVLNKESRIALIALFKEGLRYIDIGSTANKIVELGKVESDSKFDEGYIVVKYINFSEIRFITITFKYGINILRQVSLNKEEIVVLIDILEKAETVSTDLLAELNKLK